MHATCFYRNEDVNKHSSHVLNVLLTTPLIEIKALIVPPRNVSVRESTRKGTLTNTQFVRKLQVQIGARVMLAFNANVIDGQDKSVIGFVIDIVNFQN